MFDIYLCFARKERDIAEFIAKGLRKRGAEAFCDHQEILPDEDLLLRLGDEIKRRTHFILLLSPVSVQSPWVRLETAWAIHCNKTILPVTLSPVNELGDFLFLYDTPKVDFTGWPRDLAAVDQALQGLAVRLGLPATAPAPALPGPDGAPPVMPLLSPAVGESLLESAEKLEAEQADYAHLLYKVLQPAHTSPRLEAFINTQVPRLRENWVKRFHGPLRSALKAGRWDEAEQWAQKILSLNPDHAEAQDILLRQLPQHREWDPIYQQAQKLAAADNWKSAAHLLASLRQSCPTYGDPQSLAVLRPASVYAIQNTLTLRPFTAAHQAPAASALAFSPDSTLIASAWTDNTIRIWDVTSGQEIDSFESASVVSLAFSSGGTLLISASNLLGESGAVQVWNIRDRVEHKYHVVHQAVSTAVAVSPNKLWMAAAVEDYANIPARFLRDRSNCIRVWITSTDHPVNQFRDNSTNRQSTRFLAFSPDSQFVASELGGHTLKLWAVAGPHRQEPFELNGHTAPILAGAFAPDGRCIATGSNDKTLRLWPLDDEHFGESLLLATEEFAITQLVFSPSSALLISAQNDTSLHVWDVDTQTRLLRIEDHKGSINGLAFAPDGTLFASASADGTIKVWGL